MLDDWEENLAVITANRTKDDELVIIHLGDCLWKERSEVQFCLLFIFFNDFGTFPFCFSFKTLILDYCRTHLLFSC